MMVKVLQIIDGKTYGGISKFVYDISLNMNDIDTTILTQVKIFDKKIKNAVSLDICRDSIKNKIIYNLRLYKYLKNNKFDIIHIHSGIFLYSFQVALIARLLGNKNIIVHSHNTPKISKLKKIIIILLNPLLKKITNVYLSCSNESKYSLFTKKTDVKIIKNGINTDNFKFNNKLRDKIRRKYNLDNKIVYGHVGRFENQKNHEFLIDLFSEICKSQDAILMLIGEGSLKKMIKDKVSKFGLSDKVIFLDFREDVYNYLNSMDIFLFTSLYEGLPLSVIEAQTNGLPVIASKCISLDAKISNNFYRIDSYDKNEWLSLILKIKIRSRKLAYKNTINCGFDIKSSAYMLNEIYKGLIK